MDGAKLVVASLWMSLIAVSVDAQTVSTNQPRKPFSFKALRAQNAMKVSRETATEQNTLTKKYSRELEYSPTKISLIIPSFVVHGISPTNNASDDMPRKMDEGGRSVVTPGFGLEYKGPTGFLAVGAVIKDCYDNLAGTLQIGGNYEISDRVNWGVTMGVYARQTPYACETYQERGMQYTDCRELDRFSWKFMTSINGQSVDIIPMPFLHLSVAVFKSRSAQVDLKLMSNFLLNEVGFGIPF